MRILIAEDEAIIAQSLSLILEDMGFQVVGPAATNVEALRLINAGGIDRALIDYRLRDGNAVAVGKALIDSGIPFVWMSGFNRDALGELGAPMLQKPFRPVDLAEALVALEPLPDESLPAVS